ncbi:HD superfamily phosphohydrolase [Spiroplasma corruscae]|uniref:HD superfamily phosphohydrolase n=1 Tax=Spiroplasma corruscae TaxID=216934 RepID=A0A222EQG4_9MOLU|nr:HD domain-containing protein [Spiroplasma corruscae]ASP28742.1 HD superfamily phosphohydrolase [Spiroplasma corruscae]
MNKFIRDNVHGEINIKEDFIIELIETKAFQRLRRIVQLGGGQYVFPSASHTRFSHSIGTYHVVCKFLENENLTQGLNKKDFPVVKAASLLHDIGHGPFSHSFEKVISINHEKYSVKIILNDNEITNVLRKANIDPMEVASIIEGNHPVNVFNMLVSSQIDADRIDYLLRDSLGAGVNYSKLDLQWIIRHATTNEGNIVFPEKTVNAIEHFLLGRYHMFTQVYNHKISKAFDFTLEKWFLRLRDLYKESYVFKNNYYIEVLKPILEFRDLNVDEYTRLDDYTILEYIKMSSEEEDEILKDLALRIINRNFVRVSSKLTEQEFEEYKNSSNLDPKYYFGTIEEKPFCIYGASQKGLEKPIYIEHSNGLKNIEEISQILNKNSKNIGKKFYIFIK